MYDGRKNRCAFPTFRWILPELLFATETRYGTRPVAISDMRSSRCGFQISLECGIVSSCVGTFVPGRFSSFDSVVFFVLQFEVLGFRNTGLCLPARLNLPCITSSLPKEVVAGRGMLLLIAVARAVLSHGSSGVGLLRSCGVKSTPDRTTNYLSVSDFP
jgi:hypothetical protein